MSRYIKPLYMLSVIYKENVKSFIYACYNRNMKTADLDVVYFVKDKLMNEELRYSIRSVAKNMSYNRIWIFGGCPQDIVPDVRIRVEQEGPTKWDKVHSMFEMAAKNKELTDDFILFNDDFFIMKPMDEITPLYRCSMKEYIDIIETKNRNRPNGYSLLLRECDGTLSRLRTTDLCYELHTPFVFNKEKLLKLLEEFPGHHCTRTMYGNIYGIGGEKSHDVKIFDVHPTFNYRTSPLISTDDSIVNVNNDIWRFMRNTIGKRCKYEI